eukprot:CAMPEP_0170462482 /NCGR_PEP_ID=MMETSP0123-20130129/7968_1 /TAXON_ID=182087 /ORGANISM="Favella ehrenbergii, Strain Fehren 1" /LENGTH=45 /DNA_ID= /DNA_START= /DNA_END= /DNA_ORIENTATION=
MTTLTIILMIILTITPMMAKTRLAGETSKIRMEPKPKNDAIEKRK